MKPLFQLLRRPLFFIAGFSFVVNLLMLAPALFMLQVFDRVLTSQSKETLLVLLLGMAVAFGLMLVLDYLRSRLQGVVGNIISEQLSPVVTKVVLAKSAHRTERVPSEGLRDVATLRHLFRHMACWHCSIRLGRWSMWPSSGWRIRCWAWRQLARRC